MKTKDSISILLAIIVIGAVLIWRTQSPTSTEQVACTQEALICPDGSSVGRSGLQCEFKPCSGVELTGTLQKSPTGEWYLHTQSALPNAKEPYIVPLKVELVNTSNVSVGAVATVKGQFTTGNIFAVSSVQVAPTSGGRVMGPEEITLKPGQTGSGLGLSIKLNSVTADSRCPLDVQCIAAGTITTSLMLSIDDKSEAITYRSDGAPLRYKDYEISLSKIEPAPKSKIQITSSDYRITFKIASALNNIIDNPDITKPVAAVACVREGGTWDNTYNECTGLGELSCTNIKGIWEDCASACRHNPNAEICTKQCVQICKF